MAKRCSAKNCFNCVLYNKSIGYFSFPKHKEFSQRWAVLAGRADLKEKPLHQIVKYYLCSEHFTASCFVDEDSKQMLKRNLPYSIAFPSIFKNNLQETIQNTNLRNSIEVHNLILVDVDNSLKDNDCREKRDACNIRGTISCCSSDRVVNIREKTLFLCLEDCQQFIDIDKQKVIAHNKALNKGTIAVNCRLCLKELACMEPFIKLEESLPLRDFISRVMNSQINLKDDMSQVVCKNCENNALLCHIIIQQMDAAQKKIRRCITQFN